MAFRYIAQTWLLIIATTAACWQAGRTGIISTGLRVKGQGGGTDVCWWVQAQPLTNYGDWLFFSYLCSYAHIYYICYRYMYVNNVNRDLFHLSQMKESVSGNQCWTHLECLWEPLPIEIYPCNSANISSLNFCNESIYTLILWRSSYVMHSKTKLYPKPIIPCVIPMRHTRQNHCNT